QVPRREAEPVGEALELWLGEQSFQPIIRQGWWYPQQLPSARIDTLFEQAAQPRVARINPPVCGDVVPGQQCRVGICGRTAERTCTLWLGLSSLEILLELIGI